MLNKVDFPLTTSQISEFVLDKGYTTYFKLQEAISELTQSELIRTETTHNRTLYHLTESGAETIHYFSNKISSAIRKDIDDFLTEKQYDLKEEVSVKADYYLNTNQEDIVDALVSEKVRCYVTDFPTKEIVGVRGAIVIPHLGASTEESEDNCAKMAAAEVKDFLENGNITHSVNFPDCDMGAKGEGERITILHKNIPNMIGQFTALLAEKNMNIEVMTNKSRKEYAYTMLDVDGTVSEDVEAQLAAVEGVLKVRVIR